MVLHIISWWNSNLIIMLNADAEFILCNESAPSSPLLLGTNSSVVTVEC